MKILLLLIALTTLSCNQENTSLTEVSSSFKYSLSQNSELKKNHEGDYVLSVGGGRFFITKSVNVTKIHAPDLVISTSNGDFEIHIEKELIKILVHASDIEISSPYVMSFVPEIVKANEKIQFDRINKVFIR